MSMLPDGSLDAAEAPVRVEVGLGELAYARHPDYLMTPALGSCVAVTLWDPTLKHGAMAHVMLPAPPRVALPGNSARYAIYAIGKMVDDLRNAGSPRRRLVAKIAGGAAMFQADGILASVGERNVEEVKKQLALLKIPILAEDIGERHARTVELHLDTGVLLVRSYLYGVKRL